MMYRLPILLLLLSCQRAALAGDDEAHFKPKSYAPRNTLQDRSYSGSAYSPSSASQPADTRAEPSKSGRWTFFAPKAPALADRKLTGAQEDKGEAYKQERQISVPTIRADPSVVPAEKPFDANGKKLTGTDYKAPEAPREKNPLLKPRQGIKEHE